MPASLSRATRRTAHSVALLLVASTVVLPRTVLGQTPAAIGTAGGFGLGAMTEARLSEAALWNPALGAIFDGPLQSFSLLGIHLEPGQPATTAEAVRYLPGLATAPVSVVTAPMRSAMDTWLGDRDVAELRSAGQVQWIGLQSRDLLISVTSTGYVDLKAPRAAVELMAGHPDRITMGPDSAALAMQSTLASRRSVATVLAIAKGQDWGRRPLVGRLWTGVTVKASLVHWNARGRFLYGDALDLGSINGIVLDTTARPQAGEYGVAYNEIGVKNTRVYGVDLGAVFAPAPPMLVSVALTNVYQRATVSQQYGDVYAQAVAFAGTDASGNTRAFVKQAPLNPADPNRPWFADAEAMAQSAHFAPTLRIGLSLDSQAGRFVAGMAQRTDNEPAIDGDTDDRWSIGYQVFRSSLRPRVAYSVRQDGSTAVTAGVQRGFCADRLALTGGFVSSPTLGRTVSVGAMWTRGGAPCGVYR